MIFIESIDFTTCSLVNAFSKIVFTAQGLIAALLFVDFKGSTLEVYM